MKVNVLINPKKNEVIECDNVYLEDGVVTLIKNTGRGRSKNSIVLAGFKKWIRFYVLPEEKPTPKKVGKKNANPN